VQLLSYSTAKELFSLAVLGLVSKCS